MSAAGDKPDAWMPLYVADWDAGTRRLTCEEDGAYGRLVRDYWKNGAPPDDDAQLARIVGVDRARWRRLRPVLEAFFVVADGRWTHRRVEAELAIWGEKRRRYIARAAAGGRAKAALAQGGAGGGAEAGSGAGSGGGAGDGSEDDFAGLEADAAAPARSAKSSSKAVLKSCTSASSSASAADERTPSQGILSSSVQAYPTASHPPNIGNAEASATAPSGTRADGPRAECAPPARDQVGTGGVGSGPVGSGPVGSGPVGNGPASHGPASSGPASSGPAAGAPIKAPLRAPLGAPRRAPASAQAPAWPPPRPAATRPGPTWPGPPGIRALVVATRGEAYAASYLDPAGWQAGEGHAHQIIPRTGAAAERLRRDLREVLEEAGVRVGERG